MISSLVRSAHRTHRARLAAVAILTVAAARPALAQGNLSTQGYGYPPGQLSGATASSAGAFAEFDAASPLNPAALTSWRSPGLSVHYNPEFRRVTGPGGADRTTTSRFPLIAAVLPAGERYSFGLSAATLLDRTWRSRSTTVRQVGGQSDSAALTFSSAGGMSDVRFGAAYRFAPSFSVGAGVHAIVGQNRLTIDRVGGDTLLSDIFRQRSRLDFNGHAVSLGAVWQPLRTVSIGASGRLGGKIRATESDTVLARAHVPNRYGASISFDGLSGLSLGARANFDQWTRLGSLLGANGSSVRDAWDYGVGADGTGPRFGGRIVRVRGGVRYRTLPFGVGAEAVHELSVGGGLGIPVARGNAAIDLGLQRAARSTSSDVVHERAYLLSVGVTLRP